MRAFILSVARFVHGEDGPTAVEYAVMLALIVLICFAAIGLFGVTASNTFTNNHTAIDAAKP